MILIFDFKFIFRTDTDHFDLIDQTYSGNKYHNIFLKNQHSNMISYFINFRKISEMQNLISNY